MILCSVFFYLFTFYIYIFSVKPTEVVEHVPAAASRVERTTAVLAEEQLRHVQLLNSTIEDIFLFTLNKFSVLGGPHQELVYLSSLAEIIGIDFFTKSQYLLKVCLNKEIAVI